MKRNFIASVALLLCLSLLMLFAGCSPESNQTQSDNISENTEHSTTLMPGYLDDSGEEKTDAQSSTAENTDVPSTHMQSAGAVAGGSNNSLGGTQHSTQQENDKTTQPQSEATEAILPTDDTEITTDATEVTTSTTVGATEDNTEETATQGEATGTTEAPVTDATEESTVQNTEAEKTEPDFTLPTLPDSDIIGPVPPVSVPDVTEGESTDTEEDTTADGGIDLPELWDPDLIGPQLPIDPDDLVPPVATTGEASENTTAGEADNSDAEYPDGDTPEAEKPDDDNKAENTTVTTAAEEATAPVDYSGRLEFTYYGRYSGKFVEDGTDEPVENVAILMVTNISDEYLEYAVVTFDISGTPAAFTVTGLAPNESAWVLEQNRLQIDTDAVFTHMDDVASFREYDKDSMSAVSVKTGYGQLTAKNTTDKALKGVYVYYKQLHTDGNFLGGITYRVSVGDLAPGEEASVIAMHSSGADSQVVFIDWAEEE